MPALTEEYMAKVRGEDQTQAAKDKATKDADSYKDAVKKFDEAMMTQSSTALGSIWNLAVKTSTGDKRSRPTVGQSVAALGKSMFMLGKTAMDYGEFLEKNKEIGSRVERETDAEKTKKKPGSPPPSISASDNDQGPTGGPSGSPPSGGGPGQTGRSSHQALSNERIAAAPQFM